MKKNKKNNEMKIVVCIPTFKRPIFLKQCLYSLLKQNFKYNFEIIVVDNDINKSAKKVVEKINNKKISYYLEKNKGISIVRNKCVEICKNKKINFMIFIDDDEFADKNWIANLFSTSQRNKAKVVTGPALCKFEDSIPEWIEYVYFIRPRNETDQKMKTSATNNVLIDMRVFDFFNNKPFNEGFNLMCGEDVDFFNRVNKLNIDIVWCDEAIVYENITTDRSNFRNCILRTFNEGNSYYHRMKIQNISIMKILLKFINAIFRIIIFIIQILLHTILFQTKIIKFHKRIYRLIHKIGFLSGALGYKNKEYQITYGN